MNLHVKEMWFVVYNDQHLKYKLLLMITFYYNNNNIFVCDQNSLCNRRLESLQYHTLKIISDEKIIMKSDDGRITKYWSLEDSLFYIQQTDYT